MNKKRLIATLHCVPETKNDAWLWEDEYARLIVKEIYDTLNKEEEFSRAANYVKIKYMDTLNKEEEFSRAVNYVKIKYMDTK